MLLFKREFVDAILSGRKTQTRRIHKHCRRVGSRQACKYDFLGKPFCFVIITRCFKQRVKDISDADVYKEGFDSREEFLEAFKRFNGDLVTVYEFKVVDV